MKEKLAELTGWIRSLEAAAQALGDSTNKEIKSVKKRVLSAAGRAAIVKGAKRWAKVRKQAKNAVS